MLLFDSMFFVAAGSTVALAMVDKTLESYGYFFLSGVIKIALPLLGMAAGVYFIETNPLLRWL